MGNKAQAHSNSYLEALRVVGSFLVQQPVGRHFSEILLRHLLQQALVVLRAAVVELVLALRRFDEGFLPSLLFDPFWPL